MSQIEISLEIEHRFIIRELDQQIHIVHRITKMAIT
jgi:hypothetical protein